MPDLLWDDVKDHFDPDATGALPDLRIPYASADDWQALLDLVVERGWNHECLEGADALALPRAADVFARPPDAECPQLRVRPAEDMLAIFRFLADEEIDFDMDVREVRGQERLDLFCDFLRATGRRPLLREP
ncbi:hypothetical protein HLK59_43380 [Streptomyces sp. S3(2020)]|uniref:hypothetical protein n=1 Tax=Streptomyces sp. S3(2020) TaxID=2732044 RepID=UPI0014899A5B|nr:hypothetical protein [Streptomyces sp. S3(2020)]